MSRPVPAAVRGATKALARFAHGLKFSDLPDDVVRAARNTIIDGVAACVFGARFPWSRALIDYCVETGGAGGASAILSPGDPLFHPPAAALVNGALAHAFELDAGTRKGVGAHPFGTVFTAALPVAQAVNASGEELVAAFVAGSEVMLRIGKATGRSNEHRGFHAPGTTGPFGAAVACALLRRLNETQLLDAMGIAGSLASGLRQFAKSDTGGMVKRLHFGRAAESGVLASGLASKGFDGPHDVLEGEVGFLNVFCDDWSPDELTFGLDGGTFHVREIAMKSFGAHGSTQGPLKALLAILQAHAPKPADIARIVVEVSRESLQHHDIRDPQDLMQAQYSIPFCVALACVRDPLDPRSIDDSAVHDPAIRGMLARVEVRDGGFGEKRTCRVLVETAAGESYESFIREDAKTWTPASDDEVFRKYRRLMADNPAERSEELLSRLACIERQPDVRWLRV